MGNVIVARADLAPNVLNPERHILTGSVTDRELAHCPALAVLAALASNAHIRHPAGQVVLERV
jgi:hypothetical protein